MIDKEGRLMNRDYNYRDSDFTKITANTKTVFLTLDGLEPMTKEETNKKLEESVKTFTKFCGGTLKTLFVS